MVRLRQVNQHLQNIQLQEEVLCSEELRAEGLEETVQKVTVSRCLGAGHSCHLTAEETTECRQEHAEHRLVALDEAGQQLIMATFLFPSGCSCYKLNTFY